MNSKLEESRGRLPSHQENDIWQIGGKTLSSRLLIGSALYPSPANMEDAIKVSGAQIVTVSLRRQAAGEAHRQRREAADYLRCVGISAEKYVLVISYFPPIDSLHLRESIPSI